MLGRRWWLSRRWQRARAFMLPVATPPNAIVFSSNRVSRLHKWRAPVSCHQHAWQSWSFHRSCELVAAAICRPGGQVKPESSAAVTDHGRLQPRRRLNATSVICRRQLDGTVCLRDQPPPAPRAAKIAAPGCGATTRRASSRRLFPLSAQQRLRQSAGGWSRCHSSVRRAMVAARQALAPAILRSPPNLPIAAHAGEP